MIKLKYFYEDTIFGDMNFEEFEEFSYKIWNKLHGFVVINLCDDPIYGRYWDNCTSVYTPRYDQVKNKKILNEHYVAKFF